MLNTPFSPWPSFTDEEADAVHAVLLSNKVNYWTGTECREFEKEFAAWCGTRYAVALSNGTLALDVALKALGIGPGDEVVVTPRTFIASISCVVNAGATPVFADVEADSGNISAATIARVLTPRTKAVICVHLAGWPCDMDPIMALADSRGLKVIEDCAQAHGACYKDRSVGSIGHVGAWSFCQDKIMTTGGEGGMVTTNDEALWRAMWSYKDHGKSYEAVFERQHPPGFRWVHESFGTNWRMLEIQAAIGRIQLRRMADWTAKRTANAEAIWAACRLFAAVRVPAFACDRNQCDAACPAQTGCVHAHYKCYVYVQPDRLAPGWSRDRIVEAITSQGVPCYQGSCSEVYLEKAFDNTGWRPAERLPVARELGETSLMFLVHSTLTSAEIDKTCSVIAQVLGDASANINQGQIPVIHQNSNDSPGRTGAFSAPAEIER
jgi:dTDP-4-amino-4,6-dideoxygalactose transaminase